MYWFSANFLLIADGSAMQSALEEWTGQRSVPNVFIGGKRVGGCDGKRSYITAAHSTTIVE